MSLLRAAHPGGAAHGDHDLPELAGGGDGPTRSGQERGGRTCSIKFFIMGRLGHDPEVRYTQAGKPVASFSLAVDRDYTDQATGKRPTDWIDVVAWDAGRSSQYSARPDGHRGGPPPGPGLHRQGRLQAPGGGGGGGQRLLRGQQARTGQRRQRRREPASVPAAPGLCGSGRRRGTCRFKGGLT